jgi:parallel beta-helix repeat protein
MSIKIHGQSVEDPDFMNATGIMIFKIHGKVDGDGENLYESEINTVFERMHFEGEVVDSWIVNNVMGCIFVSGEPIPSIEFKPLSGTHIIDNCTFYNSGGCIRYDTMTGHILVTNNDFKNISFFSILPRNPHMPHLGTYFIYNNQFTNGMIMDTIIFSGIDNSVIKNNIISGPSSGGITFSGSNHNYIQGNNITECALSGIKLETSDGNIILDNYVKTNGTDLVWDGYGDNLWMRNEFDTVNDDDIIDSNEAAISNLEELLEEADAEKENLQDELESASSILSVLESELEEATTSMSSLEDQLSSAIADIDDLEGQIESLEDEVASRLTYMTSGLIAVVVAIIFGVVGFLAAKRT